MTPVRIVVIGGSAAGPKAAAKARRMDQHAEITLIQKSPDLSMASCGYPYHVADSSTIATSCCARPPALSAIRASS